MVVNERVLLVTWPEDSTVVSVGRIFMTSGAKAGGSGKNNKKTYRYHFQLIVKETTVAPYVSLICQK